ncbi:hypothetical protein PILCRDRAFT_818080, partial [Piloderma croceum F 1598]
MAEKSASLSANIVSRSGYQAGAAVGALLVFPFCERYGCQPTVLLVSQYCCKHLSMFGSDTVSVYRVISDCNLFIDGNVCINFTGQLTVT